MLACVTARADFGMIRQGYNGDNFMRNRISSLAAAALLSTGVAAFSHSALALPMTGVTTLKDAPAAQVEKVRWHHRGWGWGAAAVGGAIIGGAIANSYYGYGPGPYYDYGPGPYYYGPPVAYGPGPDAVSYCMQRFKSYDPRSGTYLGYDGYRHPCP
jgi:hypothetical protein